MINLDFKDFSSPPLSLRHKKSDADCNKPKTLSSHLGGEADKNTDNPIYSIHFVCVKLPEKPGGFPGRGLIA